MTISILIVDDHGVLRAGLRSLLNAEDDMQVVAEATNGTEALRLVENLPPQVVVMDISMPGMDGIETTRLMTAKFPQVRVLLLTIHEDSSLVREAIQVGAAGYILKRAVESELINAIREVAAGGLYVHPSLARAVLFGKQPQRAAPQPEPTLTPREVDVLRLIAQGNTNRQIAGMLSLSVRTVESHRANLMNKLDASSRVELVRYAHDHDLL